MAYVTIDHIESFKKINTGSPDARITAIAILCATTYRWIKIRDVLEALKRDLMEDSFLSLKGIVSYFRILELKFDTTLNLYLFKAVSLKGAPLFC